MLCSTQWSLIYGLKQTSQRACHVAVLACANTATWSCGRSELRKFQFLKQSLGAFLCGVKWKLEHSNYVDKLHSMSERYSPLPSFNGSRLTFDTQPRTVCSFVRWSWKSICAPIDSYHLTRHDGSTLLYIDIWEVKCKYISFNQFSLHYFLQKKTPTIITCDE